MFIGHKKEHQALSAEFATWKRKTAILFYGKRRVGKSTMIREAARSFDGVVVNHLCVSSTFGGNLDAKYLAILEIISDIPGPKGDTAQKKLYIPESAEIPGADWK